MKRFGVSTLLCAAVLAALSHVPASAQPKPAIDSMKAPGFDRFYLRRDARLQAKLSITTKQIALTDLLDKLADATGLRFELAHNLEDHQPALGQLDLKSVPAFSLMELIASRQMIDGRWIKTDAGYRLQGQSRAADTSSALSWWVIAAFNLGLLASGALLLMRTRAKALSKATTSTSLTGDS